MDLIQKDHVVEQIVAIASDLPFGNSVLPWAATAAEFLKYCVSDRTHQKYCIKSKNEAKFAWPFRLNAVQLETSGPPGQSAASPVTVVVNWQAGLKK